MNNSTTDQADFRRAVIALSGGPSDGRIVRLAIDLARPSKAKLVAVHVVEIDWTMPLDADVAGRSEVVQRILDLAEQTASVLALLKKYADRSMDLADACIVRMTELTRDCQVVTLDRADFSVYRRNGRDRIPMLAPPVKRRTK